MAQPKKGFFDLPAEIRTIIYDYALSNFTLDPVRPKTKPRPAIMRTSRLMFSEAYKQYKGRLVEIRQGAWKECEKQSLEDEQTLSRWPRRNVARLNIVKKLTKKSDAIHGGYLALCWVTDDMEELVEHIKEWLIWQYAGKEEEKAEE